MSKTIIPQNYTPALNLYDTQRAIGTVKRLFADTLCATLNLYRVSAPLFLEASTGLNDDLNGVERKVTFDIRDSGIEAQVVQSLAKWKRKALKDYGFRVGKGLYCDMNAIRRDEDLDNLHSIYVDQWDWEKVIRLEDRNEAYLKSVVRSIVSAVCATEMNLHAMFPQLQELPLHSPNVTFITTQELEDKYPDLTPKERENAFVKENGTTFLMKIGAPLKSGKPHDGRAPDYDDWDLNGDLLFWNDPLQCSYELSSMGIRVSPESMDKQLTMEFLKKVADRHGLVCLLHEKPFAGINGSGKHDNWSLATDTGENLLKPGKTPSQNAQFLLFLAAFIKGVDEYQDMLRCCVSYPGNDHRLGGNEAPPAIISVFLGDELTAILDSIISGQEYVDKAKRKLAIGVDTLPEIPQDTTDRNRTSPLAFTGNKFEFRMLGSSQSIASPNVVLNTIMAQELEEFADILEQSNDFQTDLQNLLHDTFKAHQRIIFNGNGYGEDWVQEAQRRGLSNLRDTVDCMPAYIDPKNIRLFAGHNILSETEMRARYEIHLENYCKVTAIEAATLRDMVLRGILPAVNRYTADLTQAILHKRELVVPCRVEEDLLQKLSALTGSLYDTMAAINEAMDKAPDAEGGIDAARYYREEIVRRMEEARQSIDQLESLTAAKYWPYPTYADILFSV